MLIEFRVENHRSIRDEQVLTMEAGRVGAEDDRIPREIPGYSRKLLPGAALYGANASGKSNMLSALAFMREAVTSSHWFWPPDRGIPRDPFAWGPMRRQPSLFEAEVVINGCRYRYGFQIDDEVVLEEWLYAWPRGRKQSWLEREKGKFRYGANLAGENKLIADVTRSNALFLSAAAQHRHSQLIPIYSWFGAVGTFNVPDRRHVFDRKFSEAERDPAWMGYSWLADQQNRLRVDEKFDINQVAKNILMRADTGIVDVRLADGKGKHAGRSQNPELEMKHRSE